MNASITPVILCGGAGTRLWPLSRESQPKQFIPLTGERTLFQDSIRRAAAVGGSGKPVIVTAEAHRFLVAEQLRLEGRSADIILEPVARNTAPAIALAALQASANANEQLLLVLPSDHLITNEQQFADSIRLAIPHAQGGKLVTFGIQPSRPETGFGYIELGAQTGPAFEIASFKEKPDQATARQFLDSGNFLWNSGMFLFRADVFLSELEQFAPAIHAAARDAMSTAKRDMDFIRPEKEAFSASPADSIDFAVMEHTARGVVAPLRCDWNDLGSWSALADAMAQDEHGNAVRGDVVSKETTGSLLYSEDRLLATIGISDMVIISTPDAVLVTRKGSDQQLKQLVTELKAQGRNETAFHTRVHRPWGSYEGIGRGDRYQVKRIRVRPGASLSLQMHHHRAEHWVVVRGTARIQRGDEQIVLAENESVFIPLGVKHRLENPGVIELELIEVQSGSYLGEDDIVRFEDHYGRSESGIESRASAPATDRPMGMNTGKT